MTAIPTEGAHRLRVRYCECDPMGVAHHASYAPWLEIGRTELLRTGGMSYASLERDGIFLVVTRLDLRFRRSIRYDDVVEIRTHVEQGSRVRIRHRYEIALIERNGATPDPADPGVPADGVCAVATSELACVNRDARPIELPECLVS